MLWGRHDGCTAVAKLQLPHHLVLTSSTFSSLSLQVIRSSKNNNIALLSSSSSRQLLRPSASGWRCMTPRPSCLPCLSLPRNSPPLPLQPIHPLVHHSILHHKPPASLESSPTIHWAWRAQTVWIPACPPITTQPTPQTCQGRCHTWTERFLSGCA